MDGTKGSSKRGEFRFRYTLAPDGGGTLLRLEAVVDRLGFIGGLVGPLFLGSMKKAVAKDLSALRTFVEGHRTA